MTVQQKRTLKVEKLARIYDEEIAPVWGTRFGKMLLRNLSVPDRGQVLDISCGTGYPTVEILRRMSEGSRLIAIDASSAMLDVARRKIADLGPLGKKGEFFRTESPVPKLSFADDVYDLVVCNLGLSEMPSLDQALRDFARVTKLGGEVRCSTRVDQVLVPRGQDPPHPLGVVAVPDNGIPVGVHHEQSPARAEHPVRLGQRRRDVRHVLHHLGRHGQVEGVVRIRQLLRPATLPICRSRHCFRDWASASSS